MNRAQQLVQKLVEVGPDDVNPKGELLRLPDPVPEVFLASPDDKAAEDWSWRYDLALQLNRLSGLAIRLRRSGKNEDAQDLEAVITRVAEFEDVEKIEDR